MSRADDVFERQAEAMAERAIGETTYVSPAASPSASRAASAAAHEPTLGAPLATHVRHRFESRFGHDFGAVRVHTDAGAASAANAIDAFAYTYGNDIVFAAGQYAPGTAAGDRLMAHELAHVVQNQTRFEGTGARPLLFRQSRSHLSPSWTNQVIHRLQAAASQMVAPSFTSREHDLLTSCISVLSGFFPRGFGTRDSSGVVSRTSRSHAVRQPVRLGSSIAHYEHSFRLYLSDQAGPESAIARYQPGTNGGEITVFLPALAGQSTDSIAEALVHEIVHLFTDVMRSARTWGIQNRRASTPQPQQTSGPASAAPSNLRVSAEIADPTLGGSQQAATITGDLASLLQPLISLINQDRQRRGVALLPVSTTAYAWSAASVDEMLAYVFGDDVSLAMQTASNQGSGPRVTASPMPNLDPIRFFERYALFHWVEPADRQAVLDSGLLSNARLRARLQALHAEVTNWVRR